MCKKLIRELRYISMCVGGRKLLVIAESGLGWIFPSTTSCLNPILRIRSKNWSKKADVKVVAGKKKGNKNKIKKSKSRGVS